LQNLTYYQGDNYQLFLRTLVMCSNSSAAFVGLRTSFSFVGAVNKTVIQTF